MLSDALTEVLDADAATDVVVVRPGDVPEGEFDAAIVTADAGPAHAAVVIQLPTETGNTVTVHTSTTTTDEVIDLRAVGGIVDLLDERLGRPD